MKRKSKNAKRPWLTAHGVPLSDAELRDASASWNAKEWERYLRWFALGRRERTLAEGDYEAACQASSESVFQQLTPDANVRDSAACDLLLRSLPPGEALALRRKYLDGWIDPDIAAEQGLRSKTSAARMRYRGLARLTRGIQGERWDSCPFMRGEVKNEARRSVWFDEDTASFSIGNSPPNSQSINLDFAAVRPAAASVALQLLSPLQRAVTHARFWLGHSFSHIGRDTGVGRTTAEAVCDAAVFQAKSVAATEELLEQIERSLL